MQSYRLMLMVGVSSLFPYTTLFRSSFANKNVGAAKTVSVSGIAISGTDAANYSANTTASTTADITVRSLTVSASGVNRVYNGTDRKSTRLNSSHVAISYAVFCLKKK